VIVDDVITAGTAIRESIEIIRQAGPSRSASRSHWTDRSVVNRSVLRCRKWKAFTD